jgi:predicted DsbA family dithiol-disulfide isomerase
MEKITITEYTDPACPWAYSAEPALRRLEWLYGESIEWRPRMVVLSESADAYADSGFTPERMAAGMAHFAEEYGMPFETSVRPRMSATLPACEAVVAARLNAPEAERPLLRALRLRNFAGELLDEPATVAGAAADVGLDPSELSRWCATEEVHRAVREDMDAARHPLPAALALDHKLAGWSGGRRYTCPSLEIFASGREAPAVAPGFQPAAAYEVLIANLAPELERRELPDGVEQLLAWADEPLATQEVATVLGISRQEAREQLAPVATERPFGTDSFWSLAG